MSTFRDANGKEWLLAINVAEQRRIRAQVKWPDGRPLDINRLGTAEGHGVADLLGDSILLAEAAWVLVSHQAGKDMVTSEQFERALHGEAIDRLIDAFLEALRDFFPSPSQKEGVTKLMEMRMEEEREKAQMWRGLNTQEVVKQALTDVVASLTGNGSSSVLSPSARSIPTPTASGS